MNPDTMYLEEDLFPREISQSVEREYGVLFYNEQNKDSYDSNHAVIFGEKIKNLDEVVREIIKFYQEKGIQPMIYQSIREEGYLKEKETHLLSLGFECWEEIQNYMVLAERSTIIPNKSIKVRKETEWKEAFAHEIFEKAGEPWEIAVVQGAIKKSNTLFFVAYYMEQPVGMIHCHVRDGICRVDYLLVNKKSRKIGVGRALIHYFVEYCKKNQIRDCYLWPDGESAEKIYYEAGFRTVEVKKAGRAVYKD